MGVWFPPDVATRFGGNHRGGEGANLKKNRRGSSRSRDRFLPSHAKGKVIGSLGGRSRGGRRHNECLKYNLFGRMASDVPPRRQPGNRRKGDQCKENTGFCKSSTKWQVHRKSSKRSERESQAGEEEEKRSVGKKVVKSCGRALLLDRKR